MGRKFQYYKWKKSLCVFDCDKYFMYPYIYIYIHVLGGSGENTDIE